jgi:hypothetical protein
MPILAISNAYIALTIPILPFRGLFAFYVPIIKAYVAF